MVWLLHKCHICKKYTLKIDSCPYCQGKLHTPHPAKYSPDDKYAQYRVMLKMSPDRKNS